MDCATDLADRLYSVEQQSALMLHRTRDLLIRQRTQLINALRAHLAELGLVAAKGREGLHQLATIVMESCEERLSGDQVRLWTARPP